ncbi:MAG: trimethylamine methyltransferase family protein, partial [Acidimicrobiia bacterium]|nr:trimethylamine methyltransferase family protein [Acidimicrobiia bacterium]
TGRRRGRAAKLAADKIVASVPQPRMRVPTYDLASPDQLDLIHDMSMRILEEAGIAFYDEESLSILREHGASVGDDSIVRFDRNLIESYVARTPAQWEHTARNPDKSVIIGGDHVVFAPVVGPPFVHDIERGRRESTYEDLINFIKLTNSTPYLHSQGSEIVVPGDIPFHERALDITYAHIKYGDMPIMGHYQLGITAEDSLALATVAFGQSTMDNNHMLLAVINVSSPRRLDDRMLGTLKTYARSNQALVITPFILAGAMGPAAVLGTVAQANAEALATIAFAQMVRAGTPCIYGPFLAVVDLQSGSPVFGASESTMAQFLVAQMARRYQLPFRAAGTYASSKVPDMQAGFESVLSMLPSLMVRPNYVLHAAGWLENGLTTSYEKFTLDCELLGVFIRFLEGVSWAEEEWAMDAILTEVQPGGHHLGTTHTMGRFRNAFHRTPLFDSDSYETWMAAGGEDSARRAQRAWKKAVHDYEEPPLPAGTEEAMLDWMAQRRPAIDPADFQ